MNYFTPLSSLYRGGDAAQALSPRGAAPLRDAEPSIDGARFREVLGHFATGVTVITAADSSGRLAGFTANAFSSVSLDPPLILVCVDYRSGSIEVLRRAGRFAVHILAEDQEATARTFARKGGDKLDGLRRAAELGGVPVLESFLALLDCELVAEHAAGDHGIFIGRVTRCELNGEAAAPLTCFRGRLGAMSPAVA